MINLILLALIVLALVVIVLVANSKFLLLSNSSRLQSITGYKPIHESDALKKVFLFFGDFMRKILPRNFCEKLEENYSFIERDLAELSYTLGQAFLSFTILFIAYAFTQNFLFLLLAFIASVLIAMDSSFLVHQANEEIEENIEHLVKCLKILIVKTETPVLSALEISLKDLPEDLLALRREVRKLINQAKKVGLMQTLHDWKTELPRFRDFVSLLISVNEGASKNALKHSFDDFLEKIEEDKDERQKAQAENLQLYLMGPVVLMLLVIMLPMMDAISYLMDNSGVIK